MRHRIVTALVVAGLLTSCGGGAETEQGASAGDGTAPSPESSSPDPAPTADPTSSPDRTAPAATDPAARKRLRSAFVRLMEANTATYTVRVPFGSAGSISERGRYQISPLSFDAARDLTSAGDGIRVSHRGVGERTWIRLTSTGADSAATDWPCWVATDDLTGLAPEGAPDLPTGPPGQPPTAVVAASYGTGRQVVDAATVEGTIDLSLVLSLVSGKLLAVSGVDPQGDATVASTFRLDGPVLAGFDVELSELPAAITAAGGEVGPEIEGLGAVDGAISVRFTPAPGPLDVPPPAASDVLRVTSTASFAADMAACGT